MDDGLDAAAMVALIASAGFETRHARSGDEALETALAFRPDIVFFDVNRLNANGREFAQRVRRTDWGVTAVLVAMDSQGDAADRAAYISAGFDFHFPKPLHSVMGLLEQLAQLSIEREPKDLCRCAVAH
ncbi:MAG TPA: response regulator [Pirellulales bacterium]